MPVDVRDHPDAPPVEELQQLTLVPVDPSEIRSRFENGEQLRELNVLAERDDLLVNLTKNPLEEGVNTDVGDALYRLIQLFGTPQVPGFEAGTDVSDREDTTFKYLFRVVTEGEFDDRQLPDEWLVTAFDYRVGLGVGLAAWESDDTDPADYGDDVNVVSVALLTNVTTEPVQCEYADKWY
mgnify:CR=1 FL=1|jgi:hypothetical protein